MDLDDLAPSERVVAGAGIVLVVDLLFLPWHSIDLGITASTRSAVESPNAAWGVAALLLTVGVVAVTLLRALRPAALPRLPVAWDRAVLAGAAAALVLLVVKLVLDTEALGIGAWLGLALAAGMASGAATLRNRGAPRNC